MMHSMNRNPACWCVFHAADSDDRDDVFHPLRRLETSMSQKSVVADGDSLAKNVDANDAKCQSGPTEKVRMQRRQTEEMDEHDGDRVSPIQLEWNYLRWDGITHIDSQPIQF